MRRGIARSDTGSLGLQASKAGDPCDVIGDMTQHRSTDYAGDPSTYQQGEVAADDAAQDSMMQMPDLPDLKPDYTVEGMKPPVQYNWSLTGTHVSVSPEHDHATLFDGMNHTDDTRPHAYGTVEVSYRWEALWHVEGGNMALHLVEKRLRSYSRDMGWKHVTITDKDGAPFQGIKVASDPGSGWEFQEVPKDHYWNDDAYGDVADPEGEGYYGISDPTDDEIPKGPMHCSECGEPFPNWGTWRQHVERNHINPQREPYNLPHPVVDLDQPIPADFNTSPTLSPISKLRTASAEIRQRLSAKGNEPIPGPMPFVYDIEEDRIYMGHPGERHADIKGQFTPGGIVEGLYLPDGKLQYRTDTDMPFTVRHMLDLWKTMPDGGSLPIKSVFKLGPNGSVRLASANIGHKVRNLAMADDAAYQAFQVLTQGGGDVYVVGGAVRDAVVGRVPKDVDLLVAGLPSETVESLLAVLPGEVKLTGARFGVFRYKSPDGAEVEIALPRTDAPSPEAGRPSDEATTVDHNLPIQTDLGRRDLTINAMAVNMATGELVDPYGGSLDAKSKRLKTVSPDSFRDDPMRAVRLLTAISRGHGEPTPETTQQAKLYAGGVGELHGDEIKDELDKLYAGDHPARAMQYAIDNDLIHHIYPEMVPTLGFEQRNKHHRLPLDKHLVQVLQRTSELSDDKDLRMAAFMHDWGKPASAWYDNDGNGHYYKGPEGQGANHETVGAELAGKTLRRLNYSDKREQRIKHLIQNHMFDNFGNAKGAGSVIRKVGPQHIMDLLKLREGDRTGKGTNEWENSVPFHVQRQLAQHVLDTQYNQDFNPSRRPDQHAIGGLVIGGDDLNVLGISEGPMVGTILHELADRVNDDPSLNNRHDLLAMAQHIYQQGQSLPHVANILDPVQPGLDPDVFLHPNDVLPKMKPTISRWVDHFVKTTMSKHGWPDPEKYVGLILTGSLTTYQWSAESDFDVSIWIDTDLMPEYVRADLISIMIEHCDGTIVPGTTHPIQCFVVNSKKLKPADIYSEGVRSAYVLADDDWLVPPDRSRSKDVQKEFPAMFRYAQGVADKMRLMLQYDPPAVKPLWDRLHRQRMRDMNAGKGDYSESNIIYKFLNNLGMFPGISSATGEYIASVPTEPSQRPSGRMGVRVVGSVDEFPQIGLGRRTARGEYPWYTFTVFAAIQHQSAWADVAEKAKRLIQSGQVDILTNTPTFVAAQVQGDHGTYESEISRSDPESGTIEQWSCTCPWNQYAFDRTREWKKLEGRVCSHVMATYWKARATPIDQSEMQSGQKLTPGQKRQKGDQPGQQRFPGMPQPGIAEGLPNENPAEKTDMYPPPGTEAPAPAPGAGAPEDAMTEEELQQQPPTNPIAPVGPNPPGLAEMMNPPVQPLGPQPTVRKPPANKKDWLTLWDVTEGPGMPVQPVNPVSIIDGRQPNPLNPMNQPGTYSKHYQHPEMTEFVRYAADAFAEWAQTLLARGYTPSVIVVGEGVSLEARGGKQPMPGAQPIGVTSDGLPQYRTLDLGFNPDTGMRQNAKPAFPEMPPEGQRGRNMNPDQAMEDMWPDPGPPEAKGDYYPVKPGSRAELLAIEPDQRLALISFPLNGSGPLHPKHLYGWVNFDDLVANPDQRTPFRPLPRQETKPVGSDWNLDAAV